MLVTLHDLRFECRRMTCLLWHNVSSVTLKALQICLVSGDHYSVMESLMWQAAIFPAKRVLQNATNAEPTPAVSFHITSPPSSMSAHSYPTCLSLIHQLSSPDATAWRAVAAIIEGGPLCFSVKEWTGEKQQALVAASRLSGSQSRSKLGRFCG